MNDVTSTKQQERKLLLTRGPSNTNKRKFRSSGTMSTKTHLERGKRPTVLFQIYLRRITSNLRTDATLVRFPHLQTPT